MDNINVKKHPTTTSAAAAVPVDAAVANKTSTSSPHPVKRKKVSKTGSHPSKPSACVTPDDNAQLKPSKLQEPLGKGTTNDSSKNLFASFSMNQSLKSNPLLQGLSGNCDKTWPVPLFQTTTDSTKEPVATTFGSIAKGLHSLSSLASATEAHEDQRNISPSCKFCDDNNSSSCSACSTSNGNASNSSSNTSGSNFFKTAHSTICIPQQSSVIVRSPFRHLMVGPKISNMPTPFNGPINNNNNDNGGGSALSCQETPVVDKNVNEENNCEILFHSGKGDGPIAGAPTAEPPVGAAEPQDVAGKDHESPTPAGNTNPGASTSSERKKSKAHLASMDPERLALILQRRRDKKFRKLQSLSALMRAPDDRHSMGPLAALKKELTPNKLLGASSPNLSSKLGSLSSNPFSRSSLNQLAVNNPWKGENPKKPCSFIHEPSLKNSANPLESPKPDYQNDMNSSPNGNFSVSDLWKMSASREPVKENRSVSSSSASSVIDDALRIAALKFIKNEVKDAEATAKKDATPISAEIFGAHKIKIPNFFPPRPKEDNSCTESTASSSSGEDSSNAKAADGALPAGNSGEKNSGAWVWVKENKSKSLSKAGAGIKSRKRTSNAKRKPQTNASAATTTASLKRSAENNDSSNNGSSSDNESAAREAEKKTCAENKRGKPSERGATKGKGLPVVTHKRRGRPPLPNKLKNLKSVKRRGRPPLLGSLKSKLQQRAVHKSRNTFKKRKLVPTGPKVTKRRGRPPKNPNATPGPPPKPEVPKLTDEDVLKVRLKIPRRRGRPSKAEAMLREMAVAHIAATEKANPEAGETNIGLSLTIRPRLTRKQRSSASQPSSSLKRQRSSSSQENVGAFGANKRIKTEPVSSEESTSDLLAATSSYAKELEKAIKEEKEQEAHPDFPAARASAFDKGGQKRKQRRKRRSSAKKRHIKNDPDYYVDNDNKFGAAGVVVVAAAAAEKEEEEEEEEEEGEGKEEEETSDKKRDDVSDNESGDGEGEGVPANRSRPLLLRNVKRNSKPLPTFTDSEEEEEEESDVEEEEEEEGGGLSGGVAYKNPKKQQQRVPAAKVVRPKPTIKICRPVKNPPPPPPSQLMPPIYNVPRVLLPPSIKDTGIPCKMCGKVHTQDHFFKYMELKSTDQPHRCPLCGQHFTWSCLFIEHMRSHPENTAQYRCEYCYAVSRKISAYFNCRVTHCPPSKEWLELQRTCDEYLARVNEAKERKHSRYTKVVANRIMKVEGGKAPPIMPKNLAAAGSSEEAREKHAKLPRAATHNSNNNNKAASAAEGTETKSNPSNEAKDRKNVRCVKASSSIKPVKSEAVDPAAEAKDKTPTTGQANARNSGRKNPNSKKPFVCEICQKSFLTFDFLAKHKQSHKSKRPFMCTECGKQFSNKAYFNVHNLTYHKHTKKSYTCDVCRVNFTHLNLYTNHMNLFGLLSEDEHIQRSLQPLVCHICNRGFKLKQTFVNHVLTHTGERPFVCDVCNRAFTQMSSLDRHRRIHQKERRADKARQRQDRTFVCKICEKVLANEAAYNGHMQSHEDDNRFFCDFCEQSFPNAHLLKTHKHNEQRPHKCKNCGRCYKLKTTLAEHKRICGL